MAGLPEQGSAWTELVYLNIKGNKITEIPGDLIKFWEKVYNLLLYDFEWTLPHSLRWAAGEAVLRWEQDRGDPGGNRVLPAAERIGFLEVNRAYSAHFGHLIQSILLLETEAM